MAHDVNGTLLQEGDEVVIRAKVKSIQATGDYCNVSVDCVEPMPPSNNVSSFCLNTKQVTLLKR
jgi:hypothetical protein